MVIVDISGVEMLVFVGEVGEVVVVFGVFVVVIIGWIGVVVVWIGVVVVWIGVVVVEVVVFGIVKESLILILIFLWYLDNYICMGIFKDLLYFIN